MQQQNNTQISGKLIKLYPTQYTISRIAVHSFILDHNSEQIQITNKYNVKFKIYCMIFNQEQQFMTGLLAQHILATGFLTFDSKSQIILHVQNLQLIND